MVISTRLRTIANYIPPGSRLADIGSDHALLPVYLLKNGVCTYAVAGEISDGPLRAARQQIARAGLQQKIDARKGDGLAVLKEAEEVDVVTIAGMGGSLMRSILEEGKQQLRNVRLLVLQPNVGEEAVRRWLHENGWYLCDEAILQEDGRIYEVLVAERIDGALAASERLYADSHEHGQRQRSVWKFRMGPWLMWRNESLLMEKWQIELEKWRHVLDQMDRANTAEAAEKRTVIGEQIVELEELLACMQKDRPSFN